MKLKQIWKIFLTRCVNLRKKIFYTPSEHKAIQSLYCDALKTLNKINKTLLSISIENDKLKAENKSMMIELTALRNTLHSRYN